MAVNCLHCGTLNQDGRFCLSCGKPLPKPCPACGTANEPGTRFCANCGRPMGDVAPVAAPPPVAPPPAAGAYQPAPPQPPYGQQAPYYPYQQPAPKQSSGWVKWVSVLVGLVGVLLGGFKLVSLLGGDSTAGGSNAKISLVAQGKVAAHPEFADALGQFFALGAGTSAHFYTFDEKGAARELAKVEDTAAGALVGVTVGDMYNNGAPVMAVIYEKKLYVALQTGKMTPFDLKLTNVRIGDFDGDGKQETIFVRKGTDGKDEYVVYRYAASESKEVVRLGGRTAPELFPAHLTVDGKDLLLGYNREGGLNLLLYTWDNVGGPQLFGKYPMDDKDGLGYWIAGGGLATGPTLLYSRSGDKPTLDIFAVSKQETKRLGRVNLQGKGAHSVSIGGFTGQGAEVIAVDETGAYYMYRVAK